MSNKANFLNVVAAHLRTLRNYDGGRYRPADSVLFFAPPALAAGLALFAGAERASGLHTSLVLFAGLNGVAMAGALSTLLNLSGEARANACAQGPHSATRLKLIKESHANISYTLLVSVLPATAVIFGAAFEQHDGAAAPILLRRSAAFVCFYLTANLALSLLTVLRRLSALLGKQIEAE